MDLDTNLILRNVYLLHGVVQGFLASVPSTTASPQVRESCTRAVQEIHAEIQNYLNPPEKDEPQDRGRRR